MKKYQDQEKVDLPPPDVVVPVARPAAVEQPEALSKPTPVARSSSEPVRKRAKTSSLGLEAKMKQDLKLEDEPVLFIPCNIFFMIGYTKVMYGLAFTHVYRKHLPNRHIVMLIIDYADEHALRCRKDSCNSVLLEDTEKNPAKCCACLRLLGHKRCFDNPICLSCKEKTCEICEKPYYVGEDSKAYPTQDDLTMCRGCFKNFKHQSCRFSDHPSEEVLDTMRDAVDAKAFDREKFEKLCSECIIEGVPYKCCGQHDSTCSGVGAYCERCDEYLHKPGYCDNGEVVKEVTCTNETKKCEGILICETCAENNVCEFCEVHEWW